MTELLGYVASAVIVLSLTRTSLLRLRLIGLVGAVLFAAYGFLVSALPVVLTNFVIIGLHAFFLWRAWTDEEYFTLLEVRPDSFYLQQFLDFYRSDIATFQPRFDHDPHRSTFSMFILRDMVPAGLILGSPRRGGELELELDYVTPRYRDMKAARFVFETNRDAFTSRGIGTLRATPETPEHRKYLERIGFSNDGGDAYELRLGT
ncbi:MAG TPA: hypothetical protein VLG28_02285 [Acidimicrobiia bacterium]|nr:hypothetical protein [Acidimicrobiia bacterium]